MQHLNDEQFARLVDEDPGAEQAAHLDICAACTAELEAMRLQVEALAELPELEAPPGLQRRLHRSLAQEGVHLRVRTHRHSILRIAAALALFIGGGLAGYVGRGAAPVAAAPAAPTTVAEAVDHLQAAEAAYTRALAAYSALSGESAPADPINRLAALEGIVLTTRAALNEAPADPVINGYHLAALEQRDEILRQIDMAGSRADTNQQEWY